MGVTQVQRLGTGHRHARLCSGTAPAVISTRTTPIQPASSTARHVLGPERLPEAIRWVPRTVEQVKGYAATAKQQLDSEELAELAARSGRSGGLGRPCAADPRRALRGVIRGESRTAHEVHTAPGGSRSGSSVPERDMRSPAIRSGAEAVCPALTRIVPHLGTRPDPLRGNR